MNQNKTLIACNGSIKTKEPPVEISKDGGYTVYLAKLGPNDYWERRHNGYLMHDVIKIGKIVQTKHYFNGVLSDYRGAPAVSIETENIISMHFYKNGQRHRCEGRPAIIDIFYAGSRVVTYKAWYKDGKKVEKNVRRN